MFHIKWLNYTDLAFSSRQTFFWLKRGGHRNPMLFNHFLTPNPAAHMALDGHRIRFLPPPRAHGSRRTPECFLSPLRYRGTGGVGHKNACLNKNVTLAPFPHLEQVFCLLEPRPFSSCRSTKGLVSRRQKTCSRFAKGARVLHSLQ